MPTPPKRKQDSARRANRIIQQRTLLLLALLGISTFLLLFAQLYKLQIKHTILGNISGTWNSFVWMM